MRRRLLLFVLASMCITSPGYADGPPLYVVQPPIHGTPVHPQYPLPVGSVPVSVPDPVLPCDPAAPGTAENPTNSPGFFNYLACGGNGNDCAGAQYYSTFACEGTTGVVRSKKSCYTHAVCRRHDACYRSCDYSHPGDTCAGTEQSLRRQACYFGCDGDGANFLATDYGASNGAAAFFQRYLDYRNNWSTPTADPSSYDGVIEFDIDTTRFEDDWRCGGADMCGTMTATYAGTPWSSWDGVQR